MKETESSRNITAKTGLRLHHRLPSRRVSSKKPTTQQVRKKLKIVEICLIDKSIVVYKNNLDVYFYFIGSLEDNELMLINTMELFVESLAEIIKVPIEKKNLLDNYDILVLLVDELVDGGILLEDDMRELVGRISKRGFDGFDMQFGEQTITQALNAAKEQIARTLLK